jgi:hypothetical protein
VTFPQPDADQAALNGGEFFRLNTMLSSAGDLYESQQGALAFALGPNSDVSAFRISYYDEASPGGVGSVLLSPDRQFVGLIPARNEVTYPKSVTRKGRTLISVEDIYAPEWRPAGFNASPINGDRWEIVPPTLDVIQYFVSEPSLVSQRSDRTFRYQYLTSAPGLGRTTYLAIPAYGRKSGFITILNKAVAAEAFVDTLVGAVRFSLSTNPAGTTIIGTQGVIAAGAPLAGEAVRQIVFDSKVHGLWDYFFIGLGGAVNQYNGGQMPISVVLSDDV